jgi:hypothetical protein
MPPSDPILALSLSVPDALSVLATSAADNVPGAEFASVTVRRANGCLETLAATDPLARVLDAAQYELREGPCYEAVTGQRFVLANDIAEDDRFPRYGPRAAGAGVLAQAATQLVRDGDQAGLNLYARAVGVFDASTVQFAELFSAHAAALLGYARQADTVGDALYTRQDIGTAVGILMERHQVGPDRAFGYLTRVSMNRNVKLRDIAREVIDGSFDAEA